MPSSDTCRGEMVGICHDSTGERRNDCARLSNRQQRKELCCVISWLWLRIWMPGMDSTKLKEEEASISGSGSAEAESPKGCENYLISCLQLLLRNALPLHVMVPGRKWSTISTRSHTPARPRKPTKMTLTMAFCTKY